MDAGQVTVGAGTLTIASGGGTAVNMSGTYATSQKLADAINANVSGVYASIGAVGSADAGKLLLSSADTITLAGGGQGFTAGTVAASQGSLNAIDVKSVVGANQAINAIDSALTTVSTMRSTYGAIQNRFDSVIASLGTTSENAWLYAV